MLDDSGTTAPGHHPSVTGWCIVSAAYILLLPLKQRSSRSSRSLTIHPLTQLGKDIVLGFKFGCTRSFLAVGQDSSSAQYSPLSLQPGPVHMAAVLAYRPDAIAEIYAPSNSRRIAYLSMQSVMVVVGAFGDRASDGNGAGT
ncbi:hypothetical protein M747DRAFT_270366 [Aspergillus niger ATCC 13496]|uniref:Contig An02c0460, genomic contig n=3 Tax=Aspergillus niger TaxID=5061 RepID=A2QFD8_ASPNC|nr:uncharacterized protein An02g14180 [Aspergillus niger]RDH14398.1 hypothetical protein M747DRAFT_270366 [Aspergillus niger ATCC 13496]CAK48849.1 unnamed protein product [Aspergillus niger]